MWLPWLCLLWELPDIEDLSGIATMSDRTRAIEVLKRARDLLAERLTERVLDSRDEILADAMGMSYLSEIETIYEQIGSRLHHVNLMLSNLPPEKQTQDETPKAHADEETRPPTLPFPSLPAPRPVAGLLPVPVAVEPLTFKAFVLHVQAGDIARAGVTLAELFNVDLQRGTECAQLFQERSRVNPEIIFKVIRLRNELLSGRTNRLLMLLWECFGLQGSESIDVMHTLRSRMAG